jgi:hypothetical protein
LRRKQKTICLSLRATICPNRAQMTHAMDEGSSQAR